MKPNAACVVTVVCRLNSGGNRPMDYCVSYEDEFEYMQFCSAAMPAISNICTTIMRQSAKVYVCCSGI